MKKTIWNHRRTPFSLSLLLLTSLCPLNACDSSSEDNGQGLENRGGRLVKFQVKSFPEPTLPDPEEIPLPVTDECPSIPAEPEANDPRFCNPDERIGIKPDPKLECSSYNRLGVNGLWNSSPLFGDKASDALAKFCSVQWVPSQNGAQPDQGNLPLLNDLAMDCTVVGPQANGLAPHVSGALQDTFRRQSGYRDIPSAGITTTTTAPTSIAIVDTAPYGNTTPINHHGSDLAAIAHNLACGNDSSCLQNVYTTLGLPRHNTLDGVESDTINGGHFGSLGDLSLGIYEAVERFHHDQPDAIGKTPAHLVINLSLGWDSLFGDLPSYPAPRTHLNLINGVSNGIPAPIQAMHAILIYAKCEGALILAATGNKKFGSCSDDALLPAAWERLAAPTPNDCDGFDIMTSETSSDLPPGTEQPYLVEAPLLRAVGGLEYDNSPLDSMRSNSTPQLLAASFHARGTKALDEATEVMTGTSVGTVVTAAAAALSWSHYSTRDGDEVVNVAYDGLPKVPNATSDFGFDGAGQAVAEVNVCGFLQATCAEFSNGHDCPSLQCPSTQIDLSNVNAALDASPDGQIYSDAAANAPARFCQDACGDTYLWYGGSQGITELPDPWVHPQPSTPICDVCDLIPTSPTTGNLSLSLNNRYSNYNVDSVIVTRSGQTSRTYALDPAPLQNTGEITTLQDARWSENPSTEGATISVEMSDPVTGQTFTRSNPMIAR